MSDTLADIRLRIEALPIDFQFVGTIKTSMNGVERETWLLEYEGAQFVFVAGQKEVVLGWDVKKCPWTERFLEGLQEEFSMGHDYYQEELEEMQEDYREQIQTAKENGDLKKAEELHAELEEEQEAFQEELEENGYKNWEHFLGKWNEHLSECLSPLRTVDIGDLIVEVDSRYIEEDAISLAQVVQSLKKSPFTLATEDEWEYLCNGGTRTLFRWGDFLDDDLVSEMCNAGAVSNPRKNPSSMLHKPNMFGLYISYDSYKIEIIDNTQYTKGGDGGCSLCGGDGGIYVFPCYTAFYREDMHKSFSSLSKHYYSYRRIVRVS